ncbi:WW-domain ligand protein [Apiospora hydei]|uniref:WW-domain ligand protein n=1 Tax=Apiospora hydei TaxID=1337664 RepID=A0ABR1WRA4_9PEZI
MSINSWPATWVPALCAFNYSHHYLNPGVTMDYGYHDQHAGILLAQNTALEDDSDLSASWVMLTRSGGFEPLPNETIQHRTQGRVALEVSAPPPSPGVSPLSIKCDRGTAFITTQRLIYLPATPTDQFQSFATTIINAQDGCTGSTWGGFGASFWETTVKPVPGGHIPADFTRVNMKLVFNDGGHSDWAIKYEKIKERVHHYAQLARETGQTNMLNLVHGEDLPRIFASRGRVEERAQEAARQQQANQPLPDEPPPDYDAAQMQAVEMQFDERERQENERR